MIVQFADLKRYHGRVSMVGGGFDPLHHGHIEYFRAAHSLGLPVFCRINADSYIKTKHVPLLPEGIRAQVIDSIKYIDITHVNDMPTCKVLSEVRPRYFVKGRDWEGRLPQEEIDVCSQYGVQIVYVDTIRDSSTQIVRNFQNRTWQEEIKSFEKLIAAQQSVELALYDQEYFTGDWRSDQTNYSLEVRRKAEGRNPKLIQEVFRPRKILDMGCGPGALMYLLHELGIHVDGIDYSAMCKDLAPPELKDRIIQGSVCDPLVADNSYDLVICREVFEHLTVLEIRKAVHNVASATSRYVYVTTRFHPDPQSLFDLTNQFDVDSTHITLLNKEFLRLMFVLEGLRQRPDLEKRMDWLNKGRVLVYEKRG